MLGWQAGILIGMIGAMITLVLTIESIWMRVFAVIGMLSASLGLIYSIITTWQNYKAVIAMEAMAGDGIDGLLKENTIENETNRS